MRQLLLVFAVVLAIFCTATLAVWGYDVWSDRKHMLSVAGETPIFIGKGNEDCDGASRLTTVQEGERLKVQRIRYWKNCATVEVKLNDGRQGYVVIGVGGFSIDPPLN